MDGAIVIWWMWPLPWLVPGCVLASVVSTIASGSAARWLRSSRLVAWVLLMSVGVILAGTLTPLDLAHASQRPHPGSCDLSRVWLASMDDLLEPGDVLGNIVGFIPLGIAIALIPRSRRKVAVLVAAAALPFAIELTQLLVVRLHRACESADIVDNLTGLVLGLAAGAALPYLVSAGRRTSRPAGRKDSRPLA